MRTKRFLVLAIVAGLVFLGSENLFAAETTEKTAEGASIGETVAKGLKETANDVAAISEKEAKNAVEVVVKEIRAAVVDLADTIGENGIQLINKLEPLANTFVNETGNLYLVRGFGCIFVGLSLAVCIFLFYKYGIMRMFIVNAKANKQSKEEEVNIAENLDSSFVEGCVVYQVIAKIICFVLLFIIFWVSSHYAFCNFSKGVAPTRTFVIELVQASKSSPSSNSGR